MGNGCPVSSMWHDNTHALVVALIYTWAKLNIKKDSELPETDHHNRKTLFSSVLYAHNASFPPLARSPPHPDAILIGCILAHLLPVIGFLVAHPCLSPGGHLSLCSAGTKQKTWIILPWTACACIRPPAPHLHADFFSSFRFAKEKNKASGYIHAAAIFKMSEKWWSSCVAIEMSMLALTVSGTWSIDLQCATTT